MPPTQLTKRHNLPSGGWVELRDHNYLRAKDRNAVIRKVQGGRDLGLSDIDNGFHSIQEIIAMMVTAWSLPYEPDPYVAEDGTETPRPWVLPAKDPSIVDELYAPDMQELEELIQPALQVINPKKPSPDDTDDPESPSGPLSE